MRSLYISPSDENKENYFRIGEIAKLNIFLFDSRAKITARIVVIVEFNLPNRIYLKWHRCSRNINLKRWHNEKEMLGDATNVDFISGS